MLLNRNYSEELNLKGFTKLSNVLDNCSEVKDKIDQLQRLEGDDWHPCERYKCLFNRDIYWIQFIDNVRVLPIVESLLGDDCHIIGQTGWKTSPGYIGCPLHIDHLFFTGQYNPYIITAHFYFQDMYEELGPTCVIPYSHLANSYPNNNEYKGNKLESVLCKAGDVLLFRSEIWHSGKPNVSKEVRYLLQVHYGRRTIAQRFRPYLDFQFNPSVINACNNKQLRLLGKHNNAAYD